MYLVSLTSLTMAAMQATANLLRWDVFCRVIDNYGDIGVCWRLCADLASRGQMVRLWVDDTSALQWMAPGALQGRWPGIGVHAWSDCTNANYVSQLVPADVWIEGFGCEIAPEFIASYAMDTGALGLSHSNPPTKPQANPPVWINLEYLSAEPYVERVHGLPSPILSGPAKAWTQRTRPFFKHFYYPGFSAATGGLLREQDLVQRQTAFDRLGWLADMRIEVQADAQLISIFCYEPPALPQLLAHLAQRNTPSHLLVTAGRATAVVRAVVEQITRLQPPWNMRGALSISYLPALTQRDFDHLLWASDLNCVRGEDSLVRALWAGKPLLWQIYPQSDAAHHDKLSAFLAMLGGDASLQQWHALWNGMQDGAEITLPLEMPDLQAWKEIVLRARERLQQFTDLTTGLIDFVQKNR